MIKVLLFFVIIFGIFFLGIKVFRDMTGMEKWALTKCLAYSIMCAVLTLLVLISIVVIF